MRALLRSRRPCIGIWISRLLLLPLLQLFHHLLRRARSLSRLRRTIKGPSLHRVWLRFRLLRFFYRFVVAIRIRLSVSGMRRRGPFGLRGKHQLTRCTFTLVANDQNVVPGAFHQLRNHISRTGWPIASKLPLIRPQTFYFQSSSRRNIM